MRIRDVGTLLCFPVDVFVYAMLFIHGKYVTAERNQSENATVMNPHIRLVIHGLYVTNSQQNVLIAPARQVWQYMPTRISARASRQSYAGVSV